MEDGLYPWSDFLKNQFIQSLGSSLGVNRMWIKRNDHAPKSECADFLSRRPKKGSFELKKESKFDRSFCLLLISSTLIHSQSPHAELEYHLM